ncbi:protein OBERON 3 [Typha latifolia]|uniref:protein OBERON 3 n=1 Tax=Typha latifolia TaxID=4733 RepID=UPI003C2CDC37
MKRSRPYGEDLEEPERSSSSSHRRFYSKSSSYDRALDDDRETVRPLRKRFDHDGDGFDRRKGFCRYRDASSPRGVYGSDRMHRSESFSGFRREFPKGFRSERDRSRREGSSGSSWRRSSKDVVVSEDSGSVSRGGGMRSRDSLSGDGNRRSEAAAKVDKPRKESGSSSEMEEGELEPDPVAEKETNHEDRDAECSSRAETNLERKEVVQSEKKSENDDVGVPIREEEVKIEDVVVDDVSGVQKLDEKTGSEGEGEGEDKGIDVDCLAKDEFPEKKQDVPQEGKLCLSPQVQEAKDSGEECAAENEEKEIPHPISDSNEKDLEKNQGEGKYGIAESESGREEETGVGLEVEKNEGKGIDLEAEPEDAIDLFDSSKEFVAESKCEDVNLKLGAEKLKDKDKGKSLALALSREDDSVEAEDAMEGTSGRGFELVFRTDICQAEKAHCGGNLVGKKEDDGLKMERLDLSLSLPGSLQDHASQSQKSGSPTHSRSIQSIPSSFRTYSDGFTTSISFTSSQPFVHNPSCSLTQNSLDNNEKSVGSRPIFQQMDHVPNGTIWHAQTSNEVKRKGGAAPLLQRVLQNGSGSPNAALHALNGHHEGKLNGLPGLSTLPSQLSPRKSHGSHHSRLHSKDKRQLTREKSSSSLFMSEQREGEQLVHNGSGVIERIVYKIVSEPLHLMGRMLQEMTEQSVAYLKETLCEMITSADKIRHITALQEVLQRRSDLTAETMTKCPRILLEILVAIKTSLPDFIRKSNSISVPDLVDIFLNLKCRNLACRSMLPVEDCECKVCTKKSGFCSACMCLVCSKFDMAFNTCCWVGCDVCLHWCHTDCGLRTSLIRNGGSGSVANGANEMQFHCAACGHPSEMFGFVKDVFRTCAKDWKAETLLKELQYVRRIFSSSNDARGKRLRDIADQMLVKLEDKANHSEVVKFVMTFLSDSESNLSASPSLVHMKEPSKTAAEGINGIPCSSKEETWLPSVPSEKVSNLENAGVLSSMECKLVVSKIGNPELQANLEKKPVADELDSVVKFKQAEAKMYQERADDARREAEGLKRIVLAKSMSIDEDYASRVAKLQLGEAEERRKKRLEELQVVERAHREYFNMKIRMEADIKDLLLKMEATKRNFSSQ